ncbi:hypothetical protein [Microseira wollei]|nr:hypothetical protein [Microseira wollei]
MVRKAGKPLIEAIAVGLVAEESLLTKAVPGLVHNFRRQTGTETA